MISLPVLPFIWYTAKDEFEHKTKRVNEMWQTDFTQFKVIEGYYYLYTVLDGYSRYIIDWRLSVTMTTSDVEATLNLAIATTKLTHIKLKHRPLLLSDIGAAFVSDPLRQYLKNCQIQHVRGAPYHPQTQGKIERCHRSMKSIVKLENHYSPNNYNKPLLILYAITIPSVTMRHSISSHRLMSFSSVKHKSFPNAKRLNNSLCSSDD